MLLRVKSKILRFFKHIGFTLLKTTHKNNVIIKTMRQRISSLVVPNFIFLEVNFISEWTSYSPHAMFWQLIKQSNEIFLLTFLVLNSRTKLTVLNTKQIKNNVSTHSSLYTADFRSVEKISFKIHSIRRRKKMVFHMFLLKAGTFFLYPKLRLFAKIVWFSVHNFYHDKCKESSR